MMSLSWKSPKPSFSFIPKVRRAAAQHALDLAEAVWQGAVDRTPVRSGELRASWTLSKGKPIFATVGNRSTNSVLPPPSMPKLKATVLGSAKFFVSNGKSYGPHVEYGSSTIMPHLMLTRAIQSVDI